MAGLRMSLTLIWFTTVACLVGYLALVAAADTVWFDPDHVTPPVQTIVSLLSLSAVGLIVGQIIRMGRRAAEQFGARTFAANRGDDS